MKCVRAAVLSCLTYFCCTGSPSSVLPARADESRETSNNDDATYYVIGVSPAETALIVESGTIKDGRFVDNGRFQYEWDGPDTKKPDGGFIVAKVPKGELLAITQVGFETPPSVFRQGVFGLIVRDIKHSAGETDYTSFGFCDGQQTVVFSAEPHRVLYIGSFDFTFSPDRSFLLGGRDKLALTAHDEIEDARAYLAKKYPDIAGRLEHASYQRYPLARDCPPRVTVIP